MAFEDRCIHRLAPLSLGRCEDDTLRCMYHGLRFNRAGQVVEIPGQEKVPSSLRLRSYPVVERYGWMWVWMGDAKVADEGLIPVLTGLNDPNYACGTGQLDYEAEARFVNDNLLDLSHASFLHKQTAGYSEKENWARERATVTEQDRGVRVERWLGGEKTNAEELVDIYSRHGENRTVFLRYRCSP